jgi:hypothetical protein
MDDQALRARAFFSSSMIAWGLAIPLQHYDGGRPGSRRFDS